MPLRPLSHWERSHKAKPQDNRPSAFERGYDKRWQRVRLMYLAENPLCKECVAQGYTTPAIDVHHIIPLSEGGTDDKANLRGLCKMHHNQVRMTAQA